MPYTSPTQRRYKHHLTTPCVRAVWAAVSAAPQATAKELATQTRIPYGRVAAALRMLRDAGYIDFAPCTAHARRIIVPFVAIER